MRIDTRRLAGPGAVLLVVAAVVVLAVCGWIAFGADPHAFVPRRLRPDPAPRMIALLLYLVAPVVAWPVRAARSLLGLLLLAVQGVLGLLWLVEPGFVFVVSPRDGAPIVLELALLVPTLVLLAGGEPAELPNGAPRGIAHRGWLRALCYLLGGALLTFLVFVSAATGGDEAAFYAALSAVAITVLVWLAIVVVLEVAAAARRGER